ncbi:MAG: monovalent cation:proton antiporter-2 (CPA2) family protein [Gammaproteobacteria bacterium]|nr:monovalent cation:proton antiporter-2 (CPA2) family protein [Gammaproteobacteria bacterium]
MLAQVVIFLIAAVVAVPLARRFGLGAVLGYLLAGVIIGPSGLAVVAAVEDARHIAELGVVLLLFVIGLELNPRRLWALRRSILGAGLMQVLASAVLIGAACVLLGLGPGTGVVIGLTLALSSTAFALQVLAERRELTTRYGRTAFAVLLFQDLAVIPIVALLPLFGSGAGGSVHIFDVGIAVLIVAAVVIGGHFLLRPLLRAVAAARAQDAFTAAALLVAVGTAWLMELAGLSMALGAFIAGMLLADSEYRHALEADIEPFKGLLLGLFFMAVGMGVDLGLLAARPLPIVGLALGLVALKCAVLYVIGRVQGLAHAGAVRLAISISQGGEFAFVILAVATAAEIVPAAVSAVLIMVVTLSMGSTPLLLAIADRLLPKAGDTAREFDQPDEHNPVIIAGFGRFGQMVGRILRARHIGFTALDASSDHVDFVRRFGNKIYYGDASRLELLRAAGTQHARLFVLAIDDVEASLRTAELVRENFPDLPVYARARNRRHAYQLMNLGVRYILRETFLSSIELARNVLLGLGMAPREAERLVKTFRRHDEERLLSDHASHDDEARLMYLARQSALELEEMFEKDAAAEAREQGTGS